MADKSADKSIFDSAIGAVEHGVETIASGIGHVIDPKKGTEWHTFLHKWFSLRGWVDEVGDSWQISRGLFLTSLYIPLFIVACSLVPQLPNLAGGWILFGLPVIGPVGGAVIFWALWMWYIQTNFIYRRVDPITLEIKMPARVAKSPRAMENIFNNIWTRLSTTTYIDKMWHGGMLPYYSFELTAIHGEVRFFINCRRIFKNVIETNFAAQYPEIQITEVEDYAMKFVFDDSVDCFVTDYALASNEKYKTVDPLHPDDAQINAYPPKTYVDFELDQEEQSNRPDPYASVMGILSTYNKQEQVWMQMVITPYFDKTWKAVLEGEVERLREESAQVNGKVPEHGWRIFSWRKQRQVESIERHLSKLPFKAGFRGIYFAPAGKMRSPEYTAMRWIWRPFANMHWGTVLRPRRLHNDFDWAYQDYKGIRYRYVARRAIDAYRRRCIFNYPWFTPYHIFSTEVLATLWHPPGPSVKAPGIRRIAEHKGDVPNNLPT